ncbi:hypothetical protein AAFF_G00014930 [Aldrovandia affinis]|uniref:Apple domain-containing protein n=1 Tax=Aldrovandia affinis TaxID=143900 RepID=A0AAD7S613_9TELE|nr:hypothetical protein AAFF_G00014930 [Aldrovandia affinis]
MTPCPLARPLLALCPVLLLLTAPCFPSDTGGWGGARVLHSTALNEKQCSVACSADTACSRSLFEKQDKKCYFYRLTRQERKIRADSRPTGGDTGYAFPQGEKTPVLQNSSSQAHGTDPASLPRGSVAALAGSQTDTGTTPTTTKRGDGSTAKATTNGTTGGPLSRKPVDSITLLAVLLFGLLFFVVTVVLFLRKAYESYQKRDYTQMDYLINGMYTDSGV